MEEWALAEIETTEEKNKRTRNGRLAVILSFVWWVVSIGGIIFVINAQS